VPKNTLRPAKIPTLAIDLLIRAVGFFRETFWFLNFRVSPMKFRKNKKNKPK